MMMKTAKVLERFPSFDNTTDAQPPQGGTGSGGIPESLIGRAQTPLRKGSSLLQF
jgi:hypothetical protein